MAMLLTRARCASFRVPLVWLASLGWLFSVSVMCVRSRVGQFRATTVFFRDPAMRAVICIGQEWPRLTTQARMAMCNTGEDGHVCVITFTTQAKMAMCDTGEDGHVYVTASYISSDRTGKSFRTAGVCHPAQCNGERSDGKSGIAAKRVGRASNVPVAVCRGASGRHHARS